jgi:hypothetical protein
MLYAFEAPPHVMAILFVSASAVLPIAEAKNEQVAGSRSPLRVLLRLLIVSCGI